MGTEENEERKKKVWKNILLENERHLLWPVYVVFSSLFIGISRSRSQIKYAMSYAKWIVHKRFTLKINIQSKMRCIMKSRWIRSLLWKFSIHSRAQINWCCLKWLWNDPEALFTSMVGNKINRNYIQKYRLNFFSLKLMIFCVKASNGNSINQTEFLPLKIVRCHYHQFEFIFFTVISEI